MNRLEATLVEITDVGTSDDGRAGQADEMGEIVAFLASDAASYINGADIQADGGFAQV